MEKAHHRLPGRPGASGGSGGWEPEDTAEAIRAELEALRNRDWIRESFGTGQAADFIRQAQKDRLTSVEALIRLRDQMLSFRDTHELGTLANELMRSEEAGPIVARELTWELLQRLFRPR